MSAIETERLLLLPASADLLRVELEAPQKLAGALGADVPPDWPPEHYDEEALRYMLAFYERAPTAHDWGARYFVAKAPRRLVGAGGYKGPPGSGEIELGYSIVPSEQRKGFASEATLGMAAHAFARSEVERVVAHTLPHLAPSIGVLEKCGFRLLGAGEEAGTVRYAVTREQWVSQSGSSAR